MLLQISALLVACVLGLICHLYKVNFSFWKKYRNVPSVRGQIFCSNLKDIILFRTNFGFALREVYEDPKFANSSVVGVYGLYKPSLLIRDPELIKSILIKDFDRFCNRYSKPDVHTDPIAAKSIFFGDYKLWKEMRSKFSPMFSSGKLKSMFPLLMSVGANMSDHMARQGQVFCMEVKDVCARFTTDVIATTIFGFSSDSLKNPEEKMHIEIRKLGLFDLQRALQVVIIFFAPKLVRLFGAKLFEKNCQEYLVASLQQIIQEREVGGRIRNDLIDIIIKLKQEASFEGPKDLASFMETMYSQAIVFLAAGYETSATTMSFALFELAKQPEVQEKLRKEILGAFKDTSGELSYESFNSMEYLEMIVNETLRMYPPVPILERKHGKAEEGISQPYSLMPYCDYALPEGMPIYIPIFGLHYDEKYWPNPWQFRPERFSSDNKNSINPMTYLPFGNGPHNCVGNRLGLMQTKCGLMHILKNHKVRMGDRTMKQLDFDPKAFVLQLKGGMNLEFVRDDMCDNELLE
ncbi:cytochrome P450 6g1 [Musca domestica]|uniref:Cytochrome P450 6g1 n=1 Tax=Musca domestica TaxID=7370 RepID=A0A1I8NAT0_MUSDO|nr:cytochrome P450 6g1 [Musca domestica]